jgi:hypothetical protein
MSTEFDFGSGYARILGHDCTIMSNCRIAYHDQMQRRSPIELEGRTSLLDYAMRLTPSPEPPTREFGPIWQYWHSGKANAPEICQLCFDSVSNFAAGRAIIILDDTSLQQYIRLPPHIWLRREQMLNAHFSDIIRSYLLAEHGGTWIDATVLLTGAIDHITSDLSFFAFTRPNDPLMLSNWFIHAAAAHPLICALRDMLTDYWLVNERIQYYQLFHFLFECAITVHANLRQAWQAVPVLLTGRHGFPRQLQDALNSALSESVFQDICRRTSVHKMSWKLTGAAVAEARKLRRLL